MLSVYTGYILLEAKTKTTQQIKQKSILNKVKHLKKKKNEKYIIYSSLIKHDQHKGANNNIQRVPSKI